MSEEQATDLDLASHSSLEVANGHVRCIEVTLAPFWAIIGVLITLNALKYQKDFQYEKIKRYVWSTVICVCCCAVGFTVVPKIKSPYFVATVSHISYGFALAALGTLVLLILPPQIGCPAITIWSMLLMFFACKPSHQIFSSIFRKLSPQADSGDAANVQPPSIPSFSSVVSNGANDVNDSQDNLPADSAI